MTIKIVVGGPAHSGKSVFLTGLRALLEEGSFYQFRACPDGEGGWLERNYGDPEAVKLRRKGTFTPQFVEWAAGTIDRWAATPIMLVDIGGRTSPENEVICRGASHGIILAGDPAAIPEWEAFFAHCGIQTIAVLESAYGGTQDRIDTEAPVIRGQVHHLERGEPCSSRPAIQTVAKRITALAAADSAASTEDTERVELAELARRVGIVPTPVTVGDRVVSRTSWSGNHLERATEILRARSACGVVDVNGPAPAWLALAVAHSVHPARVRLNSPDGFVPVGCGRPRRAGEGVTWSVTRLPARGDRPVVRVEYTLDPSTPLSPERLAEIAPPDVPTGTVVVLSGRGPNWLAASAGMAYTGHAAAVACYQVGIGATVAWTSVQDVALGELIEV
jgi:CRISPR-associated protein Csx3